MPRFSASVARVVLRALGRVARGHAHAGDALGAERVDRDAATSAESMPPESPSTTCSNPFLLHVVAQCRARARGRPPPRGSSSSCDVAAEARRLRRAGALEAGRGRDLAAARACGRRRRRESRRRAAAPRARSRLRPGAPPRTGGAPDHSPSWSNDQGVAVEDELVLAADDVAERQAARSSRARGRAFARADALARVVWRGLEVDQQLRAGQRLVDGGRPGIPDVLADSRPDGGLAERRTRRLVPDWK